MDSARLERLRSRGLIEPGGSGEECVRISIHRPGGPDPISRESLKAETMRWIERLQPEIGEVGGRLVPDSLSVSAQMVEALVPVDCIEDAETKLRESGLRIDLVESRKIV